MKYLGNTYATNLFTCLQNSILTGCPELLFAKFGNLIWGRWLWNNITFKNHCYRLNICIPRPSSYLKILTSQCDGFRRWGLWKVIRSWGWHSHKWDYCPYKRDFRELRYLFCHVRTQWDDQEVSCHQTPNLWRLNLGLSSLQTVRNKCLFFLGTLVFCCISLNGRRQSWYKIRFVQFVQIGILNT